MMNNKKRTVIHFFFFLLFIGPIPFFSVVNNNKKRILFFFAEAQQILSCDRIESNTCFIETDREFSGDITLTPSSIIGDSTSSSSSAAAAAVAIDTLSIATGTKVRCYRDLCKLHIRDFRRVLVEGILEGSDIYVRVSDTLIVPIGGMIHGNNLGHDTREGHGPGGGSCGYKRTKYVGASHGGHGGVECGDNYSPRATYGDRVAPKDFGSGGKCGGSHGGGRVHVVAVNIMLNGNIEENGGSLPNSALGSGGSVLLVADTIVGSGIVQALGGSCQSDCAAGGGGRIANHADRISNDIRLSAAGGTAPCDQARGEPGSTHTQCRTTTCYNGGTLLDDSCECSCDEEQWSGRQCTECIRECENGGKLDNTTCTCDCSFGWMGPTCGECNGADICSGQGACDAQQECTCNFDYYTDNCGVYCEASETCGSNGVCSDDGTCVCSGGKAGRRCQCDVIDCDSPVSAEQACSGRGTCSDGTCTCRQGFYGCDCDVFCTRATTCSGRGSCTDDGTCQCDFGYTGSDCSEQDIDIYCAVGNDAVVNTDTGYPCVPGLNSNLGYGFNIVTGSKTRRVLQLPYTKGRIFSHNLLGIFEVPDNVHCEELTVDHRSYFTRTFRNTLQYRMEMASHVGITGAKFKRGFFSASSEYALLKETFFEQHRFLSQRDQYYRLYSCRVDTVESALTSQASRSGSITNMNKQQEIDRIGTHIIEGVEYGGHIQVRASVSSCVLATLTTHQVSAEVNFAFVEVATGGTYLSSCDLINRYADFDKQVGGGDKSKLIIADTSDPVYLSPWIDSLPISPTVLRSYLVELGVQIPDMQESIDSYVDSAAANAAEEFIEDDPGPCAIVQDGASTCGSVTDAAHFMPRTTVELYIGLYYIMAFIWFWC